MNILVRCHQTAGTRAPDYSGSKNKPKTVTVDFATQIAEKQSAKEALTAESVLKKLLASGMSADEIFEKLK